MGWVVLLPVDVMDGDDGGLETRPTYRVCEYHVIVSSEDFDL